MSENPYILQLYTFQIGLWEKELICTIITSVFACNTKMHNVLLLQYILTYCISRSGVVVNNARRVRALFKRFINDMNLSLWRRLVLISVHITRCSVSRNSVRIGSTLKHCRIKSIYSQNRLSFSHLVFVGQIFNLHCFWKIVSNYFSIYV